MVAVAEDAAETGSRSEFAQEAIGYLDTLYRGALRLTRDSAQAEDLVQDTYVRALRYQASYQTGTNMKAWLFAIMRNLFWDRFKGGRPDDVSLDGDVDRELTDDEIEEVKRHLSHCPPCEDRYQLEVHVKRLVKVCCDKGSAPAHLRAKLRQILF